MKYLLVMALLVVTSGAQPAKRTLQVRTARVVNDCNETEKTWLCSIDMGQVFFSDSLMLFDILISFDSTVVSPETILATGTLADQLRSFDGPLLTKPYPGEARLAGFNTGRQTFGNLPLIAFSGSFLKECEQKSFITISEALFNEEFQSKYVIELTSDTVIQTVVPNVTPISEFLIGKDSTIVEDTSAFTFSYEVAPSFSTHEHVSLSIDTSNIDNMRIYADLEEMAVQDNRVIMPKNWERLTINGIRNQDTALEAVVTIRLNGYEDTCQCQQPTFRKSHIIKKVKTTSVAFEKRTDKHISLDGNEMQFDFQEPYTVTVLDIVGRVVYSSRYVVSSSLSMELFANHMLIVVAQTDTKREIEKYYKTR
jgi:hypothetical protein